MGFKIEAAQRIMAVAPEYTDEDIEKVKQAISHVYGVAVHNPKSIVEATWKVDLPNAMELMITLQRDARYLLLAFGIRGMDVRFNDSFKNFKAFESTFKLGNIKLLGLVNTAIQKQRSDPEAQKEYKQVYEFLSKKIRH